LKTSPSGDSDLEGKPAADPRRRPGAAAVYTAWGLAGPIGELQWASPATPAIEIGRALAAEAPVQRAGDDITIFDMTGLALQDLTVAADLYRRATDAGLGTFLPWPW
jgi:alanine dehydrogenase